MHRHGYIGRKFGREKDQRNALIRGLMIDLIKNQSITTTLPKAKELRRPTEKVISKARKGDLASRRAVISTLGNNEVASLLVDVIAPQMKRDSGYLRVVKLDVARKGDNAPMAKIEFVDPITISHKNGEGQVQTVQDKKTESKEEKSEPAKEEKK